MATNRPRHLYKFTRLAGRKRAVRALITRNHLRCAPRRHFNDPYDCQPIYETTYTRESFWRHLVSICRERHPSWTFTAVSKAVDEMMARVYPPSAKRLREMIDDQEARVDKVGVSCFSERYDSIVMWAHYADSHRGVCVRGNPEVAPRFHPVKYQERRPRVNMIGNRAKVNRKAVLTKGADWSYEREWRMVLTPGPDAPGTTFPETVFMPAGFVTGVVLGLKTSRSARSDVAKWARRADVPLFEARLDERRHRIQMRRVRV